MNVITKSLNYKHVETVDILVKFIEVNNPCRVTIETNHIEGLFNRVVNPEKMRDIIFSLINSNGEKFCLTQVQQISSKRLVNPFNTLTGLNEANANRTITLDLAIPLRLTDLNELIKTFNVDIDIEHYSFGQTYEF